MAEPTSFRFDCFEIQVQTGQLLRDGRPVSIEPQSFDLLLHLVRNRDRLVSKEEIVAEVWDEAFVTDGALTKAVARLRRCLGDDAREPRYIETRRARGYRFLAEVQGVDVSVERGPSEPTASSSPRAGAISPGPRPAQVPLGRPRSRVAWAMAAVLVLIAVAAQLWRSPGSQTDGEQAVLPQPELDPRRIAVLPIRNLSQGTEDDYFVDGLSEQLISVLARVPGLRVVARTSSMSVLREARRVGELGRELDAGTVLDGSVRRVGNELRIAIQLVDTASEEHRWSGEFDTSLSDVFAVQSRIAARVAESLETAVPAPLLQRVRSGPTAQPNAYTLYLRGRHAYSQHTRVGNEAAVRFYQQAMQLDPGFALAQAGLANAYALRSIRYGLGERWRGEAARLARQALEQDADLPEAHKALGIVATQEDRLLEALQHYRRALQLDPSYGEAIYNAASVAYELGRWDEAVRLQIDDAVRPQGRAALAVYLYDLGFPEEGEQLADAVLLEKPVSDYLNAFLVLRAAEAGDLEHARERAADLQAALPDWPRSWMHSGIVELRAGHLQEALAYFERALAQSSAEAKFHAQLRRAQTLILMGRAAEAEQDLVQVTEAMRDAIDGGSGWQSHYWSMAAAQALQGESEAACEWLTRAYEAGYRCYWADETDPLWQPLREEACFHAVMDRMRAEVEAMRDQVAGLVRRPHISLPHS